MPSIPGLDTINWMGFFGSVIYWVGVLFTSAFFLGLLAAIYHYTSFKYKMLVFPLYGSGKDGTFAIGKAKANRVKWANKEKTSWRTMKPWFNKKDIEPFDSEYIYQGNQIYAFELNGELSPGRLNCGQDNEDKIRGDIAMVPHYVRNWQSLQHKKNAQEFAEQDWWQENKYFVMVIVTAGLCLVMVGLTVYFTYQFATHGTQDMANLANAIKGFATIPGK